MAICVQVSVLLQAISNFDRKFQGVVAYNCESNLFWSQEDKGVIDIKSFCLYLLWRLSRRFTWIDLPGNKKELEMKNNLKSWMKKKRYAKISKYECWIQSTDSQP